MDSKIFRYSGVGSKAWYISRIKIGQDGRTGFTYLRGDSVSDGKALSFDEIKSAMSQLVAAGYVKRHSKPDAPRSDKYEVTSFGHRYLEEHKSELEIKPEPKITGAAPTGVEHHVPQIPPFKPSIPAAPENDPEPPRPVSSSPRINKEQGSDEPRINKDPESGLKNETQPETSPPAAGVMIVPKATPAPFMEQLKTIAGELALEKFADQITVKDLLDHAEKWS